MRNPSLQSAFGNIDHVAIVVHNLRNTIDFYRRKLGFTVERRFGNPELGVKAVVLKRGSSRIELFEYSDAKPTYAKRLRLVHGMPVPKSYFEPGLRHIAFRTSRFEGAVKVLRAKGLSPVIQPKTGYSGDSITFFEDPNGIMLELVSPLGRPKPSAPARKRRAPKAKKNAPGKR
jgi:catechol 2,3-dioxygenase-like lactoylglutathione lyase family enzyme